ncbi:MAG TPA: hypothetical protein VFJ61_08025 [Solirubrobacterales bacterium]|nr:hypothetical protein [Solirubrobacterales bacterium]
MAVMMSPREKWTDERLDDLSTKVDRGFSEVKSEMREGFARMEARFEKVDERFEKIDERFEKIDERFHNLHLTLMGAAAVVIATLLGALLM